MAATILTTSCEKEILFIDENSAVKIYQDGVNEDLIKPLILKYSPEDHKYLMFLNQLAEEIIKNLELAKKPKNCLEYIIVHELVHLLERSHNDTFISYLNKFMPKWRAHRDKLNTLPVSHTDWGY